MNLFPPHQSETLQRYEVFLEGGPPARLLAHGYRHDHLQLMTFYVLAPPAGCTALDSPGRAVAHFDSRTVTGITFTDA